MQKIFSRSVLIIFSIVLLISSLLLVGYAKKKDLPNHKDIVAFVNEEGVYSDEFKRELNNNTAMVYDYFKTKYGAEDGKDFWTTSFNREIPIEIAKKRALDTLVEIKVQQILMKNEGICKDISYPTFLKELEEENARRKKAYENKQEIYGPVEYQEVNYFSYVFSNNVIKLKDKLRDKEFNLSEKTLKNYYNEIKGSSYKITDTLKIEKIYMENKCKNKGDFTQYQNNTANMLNEFKKAAEGGEDFKALAETHSKDKYPVEYKEYTFTPENSKADERYFSIKKICENLQPGQISNVILDERGLSILRVMEKNINGYMPFEEVKENVKTIYIDEKYKKLIIRLMQEAEVKINNGVYDSVTVR